MTSSSSDPSDDALEPIDLDRVIIDTDYRRAVLLRLKAESAETSENGARGDRPHGAASRKATSSLKD
jgi:hypothetical protein